jgi:hypothetical protein
MNTSRQAEHHHRLRPLVLAVVTVRNRQRAAQAGKSARLAKFEARAMGWDLRHRHMDRHNSVCSIANAARQYVTLCMPIYPATRGD